MPVSTFDIIKQETDSFSAEEPRVQGITSLSKNDYSIWLCASTILFSGLNPFRYQVRILFYSNYSFRFGQSSGLHTAFASQSHLVSLLQRGLFK